MFCLAWRGNKNLFTTKEVKFSNIKLLAVSSPFLFK